MDLIIFLKNGNTLRFEKVENYNDKGSEIRFDYHGVSTNVVRNASFQKSNIAGAAPSKEV